MGTEIVPTSEVAKRGVTAIGSTVGGVLLWILGGISGIAGLVVGGIATVAGIAVLTSKDKEDHFPGTVITAGGVLCLVAQIPLLGFLGKIALGIGAVALIGIGVWNGVKFILGLKSRS